MIETEAVRLPTAVFRDQVKDWTGRVYIPSCFLHLREVLICLLIILIVVIVFKIRNKAIARRAKKEEPKSTNNWFSWEDFEQWRKSQKE